MENMTKVIKTINGTEIELIIHSIDGEVSEVYASTLDGLELAFGYDLEECLERVNHALGLV